MEKVIATPKNGKLIVRLYTNGAEIIHYFIYNEANKKLEFIGLLTVGDIDLGLDMRFDGSAREKVPFVVLEDLIARALRFSNDVLLIKR